MRHSLSTHVFLQHRLTPALLECLVEGGAGAIEVFAARHHFDYADRGAVQELAGWFRSNDVAAALHMPLFADEPNWTRHTAATLNLISDNKSHRIATMDEVKRALEAAEQVPFQTCTLHLGLKDEAWDNRALDDSLTAIEHLKAFAGPLGVRLLLENLTNEVATPEHLVEIVSVGHFETVGFALDLGHAHLGQSLPETSHAPAQSAIALAFEAMAPVLDRVQILELHDNNGIRDEHLWPLSPAESGSIDWEAVRGLASGLSADAVAMLEIAHELGEEQGTVVERAKAAWDVVGL